MKLSYIVSVFNDARKLPCLLAALSVQTHRDYEVIVTDNTHDDVRARVIENIALSSAVIHLRYHRTRALTCYHSAEMGLQYATGDYVCFPSDDGYYVPEFGAKMLNAASEGNYDIVACGLVYDGRLHGRYGVMLPDPATGYIDKTGFILRRSRFTEFHNKPDTDRPVPCDCDTVRALIAAGASHVVIPDVLAVHN